MSNNVHSKVPTEQCCGCGICINICAKKALVYSKDSYGFIVPQFDKSKCVNCGLCLKVCPSLNNKKHTPLKAYAAINKDKNSLIKSSSGGIFCSIASYILSQGGVVYGCTIDSKDIVKHIRVTDRDELHKILGSKYVQSNLKDTIVHINRDLKEGMRVLFAGTPCQVSSVTNCFEGYENLITVDIVCHGVPSQDFYTSFIDYNKKNDYRFTSVTFRAKRRVLNSMNWYFTKNYKNSKTYYNWPEEAYTYLYMGSFINRDSCYNCKYTTVDRVGDFTLCDYWKWYKYHTEFRNGSTVSGVLVNTKKAWDIFDYIKDELGFAETDINNIVANNSCLRVPVTTPAMRSHYLDLWRTEGYSGVSDYYKKHNREKILKAKLLMLVPQRILNTLEYIKRTIADK